jgi:hypothetical protein
MPGTTALLNRPSVGRPSLFQTAYTAMFKQRMVYGLPASSLRLSAATPTGASARWPSRLLAHRSGLGDLSRFAEHAIARFVTYSYHSMRVTEFPLVQH